MKKYLVFLIITIYITASATNTPSTLPLTLTTGGSVTISSANNAAQYIASGSHTLASDQSIIFSGTPLTGSTFLIWFNNTTITPNSHKFFILSQDFTTLLTGTNNIFVNCYYNGSSWTVSSTDYVLVNALSTYVKSTTLTDSLSRYVRTADLTTTLTGYATLTGATFSGYVLSTIAGNSDSSSRLAATAYVKRNIQTGLTGYATSVSVTTAINSATTSITSAYTSAITSAVSANSVYYATSTWSAGTINITDWSRSVYNTIRPVSITGNIVLTASAYTGNNSDITIILPFSGTYTVTAGANMSFDTVTGSNTHKSVLTLTWDVTSNTYIQKSFSQN